MLVAELVAVDLRTRELVRAVVRFRNMQRHAWASAVTPQTSSLVVDKSVVYHGIHSGEIGMLEAS